MKAAINEIPVSLYKTLSEKLVSIILDAERKDAISAEMTKKIIYLWRQDSLASPTGIETLVTAGNTVNQVAMLSVLEDLGLQNLVIEVKNL